MESRTVYTRCKAEMRALAACDAPHIVHAAQPTSGQHRTCPGRSNIDRVGACGLHVERSARALDAEEPQPRRRLRRAVVRVATMVATRISAAVAVDAAVAGAAAMPAAALAA